MATITGTAGNDTLSGTASSDTISAQGGNDTILGSTGSDTIDGGAGFDSIEYKNAANGLIVDFAAGTISGGAAGSMSFTGIERIVAGNFNDQMTGNGASQTLTGQGGNDTIAGAGGNDTLWGGGGADSFVFRETGTGNADRISDWQSGADKVVLDAAVMTALGASGNFAAGDARFWSSTTGTAHDADDRVILNTSNGQLWYDADGTGSGAAQLIATLNTPTLVATDIVVQNGTPGGGGGGGGGTTGTAGNDSLTGTAGNDSISGLAGNDTLNGLAGMDTLDGGTGVDSMVGGDDDDVFIVDNIGDVVVELEGGGSFDEIRASVSYTLPSWVNNLTLTGTASIDGTGNELDNVIVGNSAGNRLGGSFGNDTINGGAGDDTIFLTKSTNPFNQNPGNDSIDGGDGSDTVVFHVGDISTTDAATVDLGAGTYSIAGPEGTASGTLANIEHVNGSFADDQITGSNGGNNLFGNAGNDTLRGLGGNDSLDGNENDDVLEGGAGNDTLFGNDDNDTLDGGFGNDRFVGGADGDLGAGIDGNDTFMFTVAPGAANADVIEKFDSAADRIVLDGTAHPSSGASGNFAAGDARFWSSSTGAAHDGDDRVVYNTSNGQLWYDADGSGAGAAQLIATLQGAPTLAATDIAIVNGSGGGGGGGGTTGTAGNDSLTGTAGNDSISGLAGNDTIDGASGDDTLDGGAGNDTLTGSNGFDFFRFTTAPGSSNADFITDFGFLHDSEIVLDAAVHANLGPSGMMAEDDGRFHKAAGASAGHDADDRIVYNESTGDLWYDADGNGSGAAQLIARLQGAPFVTASDFTVFNSAQQAPTHQVGTNGPDSLVGGESNDTLEGLGGNDTLVGGLGNDSLLGGDGNDSLDGTQGFDTMDGGLGNDTYNGGDSPGFIVDAGGSDTLIAGQGTLPDGIETFIVRNELHFPTDVDGNSLDNLIRVEVGSAFVHGLGGNDTIDGAGGFIIVSYGGASFGNDTVVGGARGGWMEFGTSPVVIDIASGTATSSEGNVSFSGLSTVAGSDAGDRITAGTIGSRIIGLRGDDTLIGGDGNDSISGDGVRFDVPVDSLGAGNDSIFGGAGNDTLSGNDGNDTLDGGLGNDRLGSGQLSDGGSQGSDTFMFTVAPGAANADVISDFNFGVDRIVLDGNVHASSGPSGAFAAGDARFWASGTGTAHDADDRVIYNTATGELWYDTDGTGAGARQLIATLEGAPGLVASDITIINGSGTGGGGGSVVNGTSGNDTLSGTAGNDTINGLGGNDTILGSTGSDFIDGGVGSDSIEYKNAASGLVVDFAAGTVNGGVSGTMAFTGIERFVAGNSADRLIGNSASQTLTGQGGNDTIEGAGGTDTLWGGGGSDFFVFREAGTANADRISDWVSGTDKVQFDNSSTFANIGAEGNFTAGDARFWANAGATSGHDATDRVVYNTSTGQLYYDVDGSGSIAAQLVATFVNAPAVAATDIAVI